MQGQSRNNKPTASRLGFFARLAATWRQVTAATTLLEARLYPPLRLSVTFRPYAAADFDACVAIYRKNETGRFPVGHISEFEKYLAGESKTLIVAELESRVIGYGGIIFHPPRSATLCYGIVDPDYQGFQIGTTLTLLRICLVPPFPDDIVLLIFSIDASLPFYHRFGFREIGRWAFDASANYPTAALQVSQETLQHIQKPFESAACSSWAIQSRTARNKVLSKSWKGPTAFSE